MESVGDGVRLGLQHIALVRAPTSAEGSGDKVSVYVGQAERVARTFSVWFTEDIELSRDTVDEGLIDRFEETVRVRIWLDDFGRRRIFSLLGRVENETG